MTGKPVTGAEGQDGLFASAVRDGDKVYVKVVNTSETPQTLSFQFKGLGRKKTARAAGRILFTTDRLYEDNTLDAPEEIVPRSAAFSGEGTSFEVTLEPLCFSIYTIEL